MRESICSGVSPCRLATISTARTASSILTWGVCVLESVQQKTQFNKPAHFFLTSFPGYCLGLRYRIVGNFQGRKDATSQKFAEKTCANSLEIHKNFLPQKFPAVRYLSCLCMKACYLFDCIWCNWNVLTVDHACPTKTWSSTCMPTAIIIWGSTSNWQSNLYNPISEGQGHLSWVSGIWVTPPIQIVSWGKQ